MYAKLIFKNAKRSVKDYLIYIVTMTLCVTLFYAFLSISSTHYHPTIGAEYNISLLAGGMKLAICGISLLLLFLIHYVNRFMLRKKQSEFAVEATLGMEQKTIGLLFFGETFFLLIFSVSVGILLGDDRFSGHYGCAACFFWGTLRFFLVFFSRYCAADRGLLCCLSDSGWSRECQNSQQKQDY